VNLSGHGARVAPVDGRVAVSTGRGRSGEHVANELALGPWEGVIVEAA
jgi:hypothetical protein